MFPWLLRGQALGDPATPTVAATTDAMVKQVQAGVAPKNSRVVWDRLGYTPEEQRVMEAEVRRVEAIERASMVTSAPGAGAGRDTITEDRMAGELTDGLS